MNETMERLLDETRAAARRHRGEPSGSSTPSPGEVVHAGPTKSEWAVLARDGAGRLHVVPADAGTFVGSGDVAAGGEAGGPWTLRCRHGLWVEPSRLEPVTSTGRLTDGELERARERVAGGVTGVTVFERETDEDPEYREWIEDVVEPVRGVLAATGTAVEPVVRKASAATRGMVLAAAAVLALVVGAFLLAKMGTRPTVAGNILSVVLQHEDRGATRVIRVPPGFENVLLSLQLDEPSSTAVYLVEVRTEAGELVWRGSDQRAQEGILRLGLPLSLVPPGDYLVRVSRWGEEPELVAEHEIRVVEEKP